MKTISVIIYLGMFLGTASGFAQGITPLIVVDRSDDSLDGNCSRTAARGTCNLRAAVSEGLKRDDATILLSVSSEISQGAIALAPATMSQSFLRIHALGQTHAIRGNGFSRLFDISPFAKLSLKNVAISNFSSWDTGAIMNSGHLELIDSLVSSNKASCSGVGAMTAYATCGAGAITNSGTLLLKNVTLEKNEVTAQATTASYTNANGYGGAIVNSGTLIFDGRVTFDGNRTKVLASSGYHPMPSAGASATATGGAINSFNGNLQLMPDAIGKCSFRANEAIAEASKPADRDGEALASSRGGAVYANGGQFDLAAAHCVFENNRAMQDADFVYIPAP